MPHAYGGPPSGLEGILSACTIARGFGQGTHPARLHRSEVVRYNTPSLEDGRLSRKDNFSIDKLPLTDPIPAIIGRRTSFESVARAELIQAG